MSFEDQLVALLSSRVIMLEPRRICMVLADDIRRGARLEEVHANTQSRRAMVVTTSGVRVIRTGAFGFRYRLEYAVDHADLDVVFADQSATSYGGTQTVIVLGGRHGDYVYEVGLARPENRLYSDPNATPRANLDARRAHEMVDAIESNRSPLLTRHDTALGNTRHVDPTGVPDEAEMMAHRVLFNLSRHPVADPSRPLDHVDDLAEITRLVRDITCLDDRRHTDVAERLERFVADAVSAGVATFDDVESLMHAESDRHGDAPPGLHSLAMLSLLHRDEFGGDDSGASSMWKTGEVDFTDLPVELTAWFGVCAARMAAAGLIPPIPPP